jgi:N-methylhydantoinase A
VVAEKSAGGTGGGAYRAAVDVGGTFTDVVALDAASGQLIVDKVETTPAEPSIGVLDAVDRLGEPAAKQVSSQTLVDGLGRLLPA